MARKLVTPSQTSNGTKLSNRQELPFRITFEVPLTSGFEVKDLKQNHVIEFHRFLADTVYKKLTISQVDKLFLRKQGMSEAPTIKYDEHELLHYGKDRNPFRLFGYYNNDGYFVVVRIDGEHKTHKS